MLGEKVEGLVEPRAMYHVCRAYHLLPSPIHTLMALWCVLCVYKCVNTSTGLIFGVVFQYVSILFGTDEIFRWSMSWMRTKKIGSQNRKVSFFFLNIFRIRCLVLVECGSNVCMNRASPLNTAICSWWEKCFFNRLGALFSYKHSQVFCCRKIGSNSIEKKGNICSGRGIA